MKYILIHVLLFSKAEEYQCYQKTEDDSHINEV